MSFINKYLIEPFKYATSDWSKVFIGASLLFMYVMLDLIGGTLVVVLGPLAVVFLFIIFWIYLFFKVVIDGYYIEVIKNTLKGFNTLPNWSNIGRILIDGILYNIAYIIFMFLYLVVYVLLVISLVIIKYLFQFIPWKDWVLGLILMTVVLFIAWGVYTPLATVNFAKKRILRIFNLFAVLKKISLEYLGILLVYLVIAIILAVILLIIWTIFSILLSIPIINKCITYIANTCPS